MKKLFSNLISLSVLPVLFMVGCNPQKQTLGRNIIQRQSGTSGIVDVNNPMGFSSSCMQATSPIGAIYDSGNTQISLYATGTFEDRVKALLSASTDPSSVGSISSSPTDQTGVRFQGTIKLDASGNVITTQSKILIKIYDSLMFTDPNNKEIGIAFGNAAEGNFNLQTGFGYITFRDQYGEIRFDGKIDAQYFSGNVSFKNFVTVVSNATPAQGQLGQFYVARCAIIQ